MHGSVLILDSTVYCVAGRSSYVDGGIYLYGLDLNTGQLRHRAHIEGPVVDVKDPDWFGDYSKVGGRGALADILQLSGSLVCMRNRAFDRQLKASKDPAPPHLQPLGGFLDDTYFKRYYWYYGTPMTQDVYQGMARPQITKPQMTSALAQLLVQDETALYGMRMFDSMKLLNANNYFVPAKEGYLIFKVPPGEGDPTWTQRVPIRVKAMAVTPDRLVLCGAPDVVDPADPLGAFEARKGGRLRLLSTTDGSTLEEHKLDSPPVFNGIAVARGRLFLSRTNGKITCFAAGK